MKRMKLLPVLAIAVAMPCMAMAQPPGGRRGPGGPGGPRGDGPEGRGPMGSPLQFVVQMFDRLDTDQDGALTKDELTAAMQEERRGGNRRPGGHPQAGRDGGDRPAFGRPERGPAGPQGRGRPGRPGDEDQDGQHGPDGRRAQFDGPRGPQGPGGPGRPEGPGGPPPRPGQILPEFVVDHLELTPGQREKLAALQAEVDKELAAILTDEQKQELEEHRHRGPRGEGGPERGAERRGNDRPQRPQRPQ